MITDSRPIAGPLALSASTEATAYWLFALAIALTTVGAWVGMFLAPPGLVAAAPLLLLVEFALLLTAGWWSRTSPLNILMFAVFPLVSGFTLVPYLLYVLQAYENGPSLVLNALSATVCMALAAGVAARALKWDLSWMGRALFFSVLGLLFLGILQLFVPSLRTSGFEMALSGAGVIVFSLFTAYDIQRIHESGRMGANAFLLALRLYLDIFNLFLYVLRFMTALSGNRR